jgi:hypothetical protein
MQPLELEGFVSRPSWDWLVEVALRLNVVIDVIGDHDTPICPVGSTLEAAVVRTMLTSGEPALRAAIATAIRSRTPVAVVIKNLQAVCFRLAPGGLLLLARKLEPDDSTAECREDLESIGPWLTAAIDASLGQPNAISVEGYRMVSIRRILREATTRGSLRQVLGAFIEALSVWDDVRVSAYIAGASGGFFEYTSSMSAHASPLDALDESIVPPIGRMARLSRADVEGAGLAIDPGDTLLCRLLVGTDTAWVLIFSGMISNAVQVRLRVYSDILRESLNDLLTASTTRIIAELSLRQSPLNEPVNSAAQTALNQLAAAVGGHQSALVVTTTTGRQALAVGNADLLSPADRGRIYRLVVRSSDAGGIMSFVVEREHPPFTSFEREIGQAGVAAMQPWIEAALPRANDIERRCKAKPVDAVFDQLAADALSAGQPASVIVMSVDPAIACPGLLSTWVSRIRGRLRGADRAGLLNDRELAVLLYGASSDQATLVCARLKHLVESGGGIQGFVHPTIGMTTSVPGRPFHGSLVDAARASVASLP